MNVVIHDLYDLFSNSLIHNNCIEFHEKYFDYTQEMVIDSRKASVFSFKYTKRQFEIQLRSEHSGLMEIRVQCTDMGVFCSLKEELFMKIGKPLSSEKGEFKIGIYSGYLTLYCNNQCIFDYFVHEKDIQLSISGKLIPIPTYFKKLYDPRPFKSFSIELNVLDTTFKIELDLLDRDFVRLNQIVNVFIDGYYMDSTNTILDIHIHKIGNLNSNVFIPIRTKKYDKGALEMLSHCEIIPGYFLLET